MHHLSRGARALGGLLGHGEDVLDVGGHVVGAFGLFPGLGGNAHDQLVELAGHAVDVFQRLAGRVGQLRTFHHTARRALHGGHRIVGVGLNGLDQRGNPPRGIAGAFREALHLLGHHREATSGLTGRCGLNGGVQSQHVGLLGNVRDQLRDLADFLRGLAQPLDALGRLLDRIADRVHTGDVVLHRRQTLLGRLTAQARHLGRGLRLCRHLVDSVGHAQHGLAGRADLMQLLFRGRQQVGGGLVHRTGGVGHASRRRLHLSDQVAQLFHGVVHRVGDRAGDVFRHRGLLGQVAFSDRGQLVHQSQNRRLVGVVDALGLLLLGLGLAALCLGQRGAFGLIGHEQAQETKGADDQRHQRHHQEEDQPPTGTGGRLQLGGRLLQAFAQRLGVVEHRGLRLARRHQALQIAQNGRGLNPGLLVLLQQRLQALLQLRILRGAQAQLGAAADQRLGDQLEGVQVLAEQEHGLGADAFLRQELVGALADALSQHDELTDGRDLTRRRTDLQRLGRHRFGGFEQVAGLAVDRTQRLAHLGQDLFLGLHDLAVLLGPLDQRLERLQRRLYRGRGDRQRAFAGAQVGDDAGQGADGLPQLAEGRRVAHQGRRHGLRHALGVHQRLAGGPHLGRTAVRAGQHKADRHRGAHQTQHDEAGEDQLAVAPEQLANLVAARARLALQHAGRVGRLRGRPEAHGADGKVAGSPRLGRHRLGNDGLGRVGQRRHVRAGKRRLRASRGVERRAVRVDGRVRRLRRGGHRRLGFGLSSDLVQQVHLTLVLQCS
mmetsp:Transcript_9625/g.22383  ORF Transcript_9625/g.22383 Transcript_9625/m.22383 type:complete len:774 (-) Transcript_9625:5462-7783(-)